MRSSLRVSLAALAVTVAGAFAVAGVVAQPAPPPGPPGAAQAQQRMQRWIDDRTAMLDARIAGLKAVLKLTPEQEKLWGPFESAARDFAQMRKARMQSMMECVGATGSADSRPNAFPPPPPSSIERLDAAATRLSETAAALKGVADAGKPLYASLDEQQKRAFDLLSRDVVMMRHGSRGPGSMMAGPRGGPEPMMGHGPRGQGPTTAPPPPPPPGDALDDTDNEE